MVSGIAQWTWLETWAWVNARPRRKRANAPNRTIRNDWKIFTPAEKIIIGGLIGVFRAERDAFAVTKRGVLEEPEDLEDPAANDAYHQWLNDMVEGVTHAWRTTRLLLNRIQRPVPLAPAPRVVLTWLEAIQAELENEGANAHIVRQDFENRLDERRLALWAAEHPAGTPLPSSPADVPDRPIPPPPNASWIGGFPLGPGGQALPAVYVRQNRNGQIIDRVVIKDTAWPYVYPEDAIDPAAAAVHERPYLWDPDVNWGAANHEIKQPAEIAALTRLNPLPLSEGVIKLRSWHRVYVDGLLRRYRSYSEFCSFGDLYHFSRKYTPYNDIRDRPRPNNPDEQDWIPEAFVWACFEHLTRAGILMESGPPGTGPPWSQIMHNDLKIENIFLGENTSNIYKGYPIPKIGDWGLCSIFSSDPGRTLPNVSYIGTGTPANQAPEQLALRPNGQHNVAAHTNIWGIGVIIWSLLHSFHSGIYLYDDEDVHIRPRTAAFSASHMTRYSAALRNLVLQCLELDPADRPTFTALIHSIRQATNPLSATSVDRSSGLRGAAADDPRFRGDRHSLRLGGEKWPISAHLAKHWVGDEPVIGPVKGPLSDLDDPDAVLFGPVAAGGRV